MEVFEHCLMAAVLNSRLVRRSVQDAAVRFKCFLTANKVLRLQSSGPSFPTLCPLIRTSFGGGEGAELAFTGQSLGLEASQLHVSPVL